MGKLIEIDEFTEEVYQLEVTDFVEGGENGVDNKPHKALANRTRWLKGRIDAFIAGAIKVKNANLADTATKLETARKINGVAFDGSADIAVSDTTIVGQVAFFAMETAPAGWLKANGATISRTTYSNLFNAIGTTFGAGDGSTTFQLPDLRGEFIRGWSDNKGVDTGRGFGTTQNFMTYINNGVLIRVGNFDSDDGIYDHSGASYTKNVNDFHPAPWGNSNSLYTETRPRNIALLACIKY